MNFYHRDLSYSIGGDVIGVPPGLIFFSLFSVLLVICEEKGERKK